MRPPHEAGEVFLRDIANICIQTPSMRPPHEAGEVILEVMLASNHGTPSMRPPHEAGEVRRVAALEKAGGRLQ